MFIIPTINATDLADAKKKTKIIKSFLPRGKWLQIDVSDGAFSDVKSWGNPGELGELKLGGHKVEVHLMVEDVERVVGKWLGCVDRIIVHLEAVKDLAFVLKMCKKHGVELMLAVNPETAVENLIPYFHSVKYFQLLAVTPGRSGQKFQESIWEKVEFLREQASDVKIEIDGGVNPAVASRAKSIGVYAVASGSYVLDAVNPKVAFKQLVEV